MLLLSTIKIVNFHVKLKNSHAQVNYSPRRCASKYLHQQLRILAVFPVTTASNQRSFLTFYHLKTYPTYSGRWAGFINRLTSTKTFYEVRRIIFCWIQTSRWFFEICCNIRHAQYMSLKSFLFLKILNPPLRWLLHKGQCWKY